MKLGDIIKSNNWLSVELTLLSLYPDQEEMLEEYKSVYEKLINMESEESYIRIVLNETIDELDDEIETYIDVSGQDDTKDEHGRNISYAIEFVAWKKWLGMDVAPQTLMDFSELEIIAHCLYEMTFVSFEKEEIIEQCESLDRTIEEFKNKTDEEKKQNTISLDEFKRRFDENGDS